MRLKRTHVTLSLLLAVATSAAWPSTSLDEASAAFHEGDYPRSLALYEQVLSEEPDNLQALFRSALLLSWDNRLDEALIHYERLLRLDPDNRDAAIEQAKVQSWDGRLDEAIDTLDRYLDRYPDDLRARLSLARVRSWNGEYPEAREVYAAILADRPGNVESMVGTARSYAWAGQLRQAREWYRRTLALDPGNKNAELGLAYADLWSGDAASADRRARELERRFPGDKDVAELSQRTHEATRPWVLGRVDRIDDSDENRLQTYDVSTGWTVAGLRVGGGVTHYAMSDPLASASINSIYGNLGLRPGQGQQIDLRLSVDSNEGSTGEDDTKLLGSASYSWGLDGRWQAVGSVGRYQFYYSPLLTTNGITFDEINLSGSGRIGQPWRVFVIVGGADFSDGNARTNFLTGFSYRWQRITTLNLETGYKFRYMNYDEQLLNGYFDPSDFTAHLAQSRVSGTFGGRGYTYNASLELGVQSFTRFDVRVSNDFVIQASASMGIPVGAGFSIEPFAAFGNYAATSPGGFESVQVGVRLRWSPEKR